MDRQDTRRANTAPDRGTGTPAEPTATQAADCAVMLGAVRARLATLTDRMSNGHVSTRLGDFQAFVHGAALDECDSALNQLQAMVNLHLPGSRQLALEVSELRRLVSMARSAPERHNRSYSQVLQQRQWRPRQ